MRASCGALRLHSHHAGSVQHLHLLARTMRDEKSGPHVGKRMARVFAKPKATPACKNPLPVRKQLPALLTHSCATTQTAQGTYMRLLSIPPPGRQALKLIKHRNNTADLA